MISACKRSRDAVEDEVTVHAKASSYTVIRVSNEISQLSQIQRDCVSTCRVVWPEHITDKQRSAKSFLFAGKFKTMEIAGGASQSWAKYYLFKLHSAHNLSFVGKNTPHHAAEISKLFDVATALFPGHSLKGVGPGSSDAGIIDFGLPNAHFTECDNPNAHFTN